MTRSGRPIVAVTAWLCALPGATIGALALARVLAPWEALACFSGVVLSAAIGGIILRRDLERFALAIGSPEGGDVELLTPGLERLARSALETIGTERRGRQLATSGAALGDTLLDRLPDPLFRLEENGGPYRIAWRNPAAAMAFGTEESAILRHPALRAAISQTERMATPVRAPIALAAPVARDADAVLIPTGAPGERRPIFLLLADRTRERNLDRMRADFVANASHELRTPLTSLIGFIETLRGPAQDDPDASRHFLGIMAEQSDRMHRIIDDLLSLSRIEMIEHQPPDTPIQLTPVLRDAVRFLEPVIDQAGATVKLDLAGDLPDIRGDSRQLGQVFGNLIDNAIKYGAVKHGTSGTTVRLTAACSPAGDFVQPGVVISVADDGPGIAREHLPRLTERFYRVDKGRSRAIGGTGLGLAIVKHVVSRHRGRLVIDSAEGQGTIVRVWLPLAPAPPRGLQTGQMTVARKG